MGELTDKEKELVALGAALGSNCVPCIEYHVPEARKTGLTDAQIGEAIRLADKVRQVPAKKVLAAAMNMLPAAQLETQATRAESGCDQPATRSGSEQPCCS
jgi:AhpD family alkylhydroperoxidase